LELSDLTFKKEPTLKNEPSFLNEPAIISHSVGHFSNEAQEPTLIAAKTKTEPTLKSQLDMKAFLLDAERKEDVADLLTEAIIDSLLKECVVVPQPRKVDGAP